MINSPRKPLLLQFWDYIRKPTYPPLRAQPLRQTLSEVSQLFWFSLLVRLLLSIPLMWAVSAAGMDNQLTAAFEGMPVLLILGLGALLIPVIEELWFRLFLRPSPINLVGALLAIAYLVGVQLLPILSESSLAAALSGNNQWVSPWGVLFLIVLGSFGLYLLVKRYYNPRHAEQFYSKNIAYLYYASSLLFGFIHVFNFAGIWQHFYLSPLIMLPYTVIGLVLGYIRIQHGFQWAVGLHAVNNAYAFLPFVIVYGLTGSTDMSDLSTATPTIESVVATLIVVVWGIGSLWMMIATCRRLWRDYRRYQLNRSR
ncbi:MAG: CPBP family glutamic-type intramembrane protease [Cyanobacteria bacterium J06626_18]